MNAELDSDGIFQKKKQEERDLLGCFGSIATRTIGVASKFSGVNGGQAGDDDSVADLSTKSCNPPIPERN